MGLLAVMGPSIKLHFFFPLFLLLSLSNIFFSFQNFRVSSSTFLKSYMLILGILRFLRFTFSSFSTQPAFLHLFLSCLLFATCESGFSQVWENVLFYQDNHGQTRCLLQKPPSSDNQILINLQAGNKISNFSFLYHQNIHGKSSLQALLYFCKLVPCILRQHDLFFLLPPICRFFQKHR